MAYYLITTSLLKIKLKIDKNKGLDIANTCNNMGNGYLNQGKYDDAVCMYENSLKNKLSALW